LTHPSLAPRTEIQNLVLLLNPAIAVPQNADKPLTNQGVFNSGMMLPEVPPTHSLSLKVGRGSGEISYICALHDASGVKGSLVVSP
jgi:hypothetical protein